LINWLAIGAACTALIVIIATITKPLWQGAGAERDTASEAPKASRLFGRPAVNNAPADNVTGIAAESGALQSSSVQAQIAPIAREFEQKPINIPVQGVTENEIRFGFQRHSAALPKNSAII